MARICFAVLDAAVAEPEVTDWNGERGRADVVLLAWAALRRAGMAWALWATPCWACLLVRNLTSFQASSGRRLCLAML